MLPLFAELDMENLDYVEKDGAHTKRSRELLHELVREGPAKCKNLAGAILQSLLTRKMLLRSLHPDDMEMEVSSAVQLDHIPSRNVLLGHCGFVAEDYANAFSDFRNTEIATAKVYISGLGYVPVLLEAPMMFEQLPKAATVTLAVIRNGLESERGMQVLTFDNINAIIRNNGCAPPSIDIRDYRALTSMMGTSKAVDEIFQEAQQQKMKQEQVDKEWFDKEFPKGSIGNGVKAACLLNPKAWL